MRNALNTQCRKSTSPTVWLFFDWLEDVIDKRFDRAVDRRLEHGVAPNH